MAKLRQNWNSSGLNVSDPEYEETKEILNTKFGDGDLEKMQPLRAADVQGFERFTDLVRVIVLKLQAVEYKEH